MKLLMIKDCETPKEKNYRLNAYDNFSKKIKEIPKLEVMSYGLGHKDYSPDKTIQDVISLLYGDEHPDVIYIWRPEVLAASNFYSVPCKKYAFWTDTHITNPVVTQGMLKHSIDLDLVLHNYTYELASFKATIAAKEYIHFPCWSSDIYKYDGRQKPIDFLLTGTYTPEYEFRARYRNLQLEGTIVDRLHQLTDTAKDNNLFRDNLLSSKFSLLDGGVNGRVVPRYFESCLAKSVVVSPDLGEELASDGFKDGVNCVLFDRRDSYENISAKINEARSNWQVLSENAYDLAYNNHTTDKRISTLLSLLS